MHAQLIPGIAFDFGGGRVYTIPPLSLGALELLQERINALSGQELTSLTTVATIVDATTAALRRNYPDITRDQVAELVDVGNLAAVFGAVMDVTGVKRRALEAGEGNVAGPGAASSGPPSTPESPAAPGGAFPTSGPT